MGDQKVGVVTGLQVVEEVVDALGHHHHGLPTIVAVGEDLLHLFEFFPVPGRSLKAAEVLLDETGLCQKGLAGHLCHNLRGFIGPLQGRGKYRIEVKLLIQTLLPQFPVSGISVTPQILFASFHSDHPWRVK